MKSADKIILMGVGERLRRVVEAYPVVLEEIVGHVEDVCPPQWTFWRANHGLD